MGKQVFETDYLEWTSLAAHAQRKIDQDRCSGADAAVNRVDALGRKLVKDAQELRFEDAAIDLGRAIHTIQDECAHHGMTNEEHAFLSLEQTCTNENTSPDTKPEAIACAEQRTRDVMRATAIALGTVQWGSGIAQLCRGADNKDDCNLASLPSPFQACDFLAMHKEWDGQDSSWNDDIVGPALVEAFRLAIVDAPAAPSVCAGNPNAIDPPSPHGMQSNIDHGCGLTSLGCLGKVDDTTEVDPYGEDVSTDSGGCMAGSTPGLILFGFALLVPRRRRR
jgi:hypothetical protein